MNILEISNTLKIHCLTKAFVEGDIYLSIPAVSGSPGSAPLPYAQASFTITDFMASLTNPVQFAVPAGTIIDKVYISNSSLLNGHEPRFYDVIELEGDEVVDFTESGIYLISAINITLTERND